MTPNAERVLKAVALLNASGRTTNTSQIAAETGLPRSAVTAAAAWLQDNGDIKDVSKTSARNWRITLKGKQYQP